MADSILPVLILDIQSLQDKVKGKPFLSGVSLTTEATPAQDKIVIYDIPSDVTFDNLYLHYEKHAGPVDETLSKLENGVALLTFDNPQGTNSLLMFHVDVSFNVPS